MLFTLNRNVQASRPSLPDEDILYGDANNDGVVNVLDIITIVNYIMGGNPDPFNFEAADVNNDGIINVLDIIFETNVIMETPGTPCAGMPLVTYEGQAYNTVKIGDQCWFRENLNVGAMIISDQGGQLQTDNDIIEKYCYENISINCDTYGGLYEWTEAMQYGTVEGVQGICPAGWHIPSDNEWKIMEGTVDSQYGVGNSEWDFQGWRGYDAGGKIKSLGTIQENDGLWEEPNEGATNESGFTALPGNIRYFENGWFPSVGIEGDFWTSSQYDLDHAWLRYLSYEWKDVYRTPDDKNNGLSVRCLKDCWPDPTQSNAGPDQINVPGTSTALAGNSPTYGTGLWVIVSGVDGTVVTSSSPTSEFQGIAGNEYTLSWIINTVCNSSVDTVQISFASAMGQPCPGIPTVEYEGQVYNTVQIGDQCWLKENLNVGTRINSTHGGFQQTNSGMIEKYCFDNNEANCDVYGGLYEWPEAMQNVTTEGAQGICPAGFHIPTDNEWKILEGTIDCQFPVGDPEWDGTGYRGFDAGGNLKESGTTHWISPNTGATNSSGFTGLPGGYRHHLNGDFHGIADQTTFWSSSQINMFYSLYRDLDALDATVYRDSWNKDSGYSVRCLKDTDQNQYN